MSAMTRLGERVDQTAGSFEALNAEAASLRNTLGSIGSGGGGGGGGVGGGGFAGKVGPSGGASPRGNGLPQLGGGDRTLPQLQAIHSVLLAGFQALIQQQAKAARSNDATTRASR